MNDWTSGNWQPVGRSLARSVVRALADGERARASQRVCHTYSLTRFVSDRVNESGLKI